MSLISESPRTLGAFEIGPLGFGCWRFTDDSVEAAYSIVDSALDLGMNLVDTADVYGLDWGGTGFGLNEEILGKVLAANPGLRERMVLATKGGIIPPTPYNSGSTYLVEAVEASLRRLQTERIDLYQIHRPDVYTHPEELAHTLTSLRDAGKIAEVGVSNYTPAQTDTLQHFLPFPLVSDQPQYSLIHQDPMHDGTFDRAMRADVVPLAWSPLAGGQLATGEGLRPELVTEMDRLAEREGVSRGTIAVAFVLAHPSRPVALIGSQKAERLAEMAAAVKVNLDRDDVYSMIPAATGIPLP